MTTNQTPGEAVKDTLGAGGDEYKDKLRQKLDAQEQAKLVAEKLKHP